MRTLDQIIAEQRSPEELERLLRYAEESEHFALLAEKRRQHTSALLWRQRADGFLQAALDIEAEASIPAPPDAPGEEAAARRDRT